VNDGRDIWIMVLVICMPVILGIVILIVAAFMIGFD
jgi:hypothetical protein